MQHFDPERQRPGKLLRVCYPAVHPLSQNPRNVHAAVARVVCGLLRAVSMLETPASSRVTRPVKMLGPFLDRLNTASVREETRFAAVDSRYGYL